MQTRCIKVSCLLKDRHSHRDSSAARHLGESPRSLLPADVHTAVCKSPDDLAPDDLPLISRQARKLPKFGPPAICCSLCHVQHKLCTQPQDPSVMNSAAWRCGGVSPMRHMPAAGSNVLIRVICVRSSAHWQGCADSVSSSPSFLHPVDHCTLCNSLHKENRHGVAR